MFKRFKSWVVYICEDIHYLYYAALFLLVGFTAGIMVDVTTHIKVADIANWVGGVSAMGVLIISVKALSTWKKQNYHNHKADLTFKCYRSLIDMQDCYNDIFNRIYHDIDVSGLGEVLASHVKNIKYNCSTIPFIFDCGAGLDEACKKLGGGVDLTISEVIQFKKDNKIEGRFTEAQREKFEQLDCVKNLNDSLNTLYSTLAKIYKSH